MASNPVGSVADSGAFVETQFGWGVSTSILTAGQVGDVQREGQR